MGAASNGRSSKFASDVLVNTVANLVAAALIYLGGVALGIFPRSPRAVAAAFAVVLVVSSVSLIVRALFLMAGRKTVLLFRMGLIAAYTAMALWGFFWLQGWPRWLVIVWCILVLAYSGSALIVLAPRRNWIDGFRIAGMQWIPEDEAPSRPTALPINGPDA